MNARDASLTPSASTTLPGWNSLTAAPHRGLFLAALVSLASASLWWIAHLVARVAGGPREMLSLTLVPLWAHVFPLLFTALPAFMCGFLFTTFSRWMDGPLIGRGVYIPTAIALVLATLLWLVGIHAALWIAVMAAWLATVALAAALAALAAVVVAAQKIVIHAVVALIAFAIGILAAGGFAISLAHGGAAWLLLFVRLALWGFLLPIFFNVCHRMVPFFSHSALADYAMWRPTWVLIGFVGTAYARFVGEAHGWFAFLPPCDLALLLLAALCAWRWSDRRARGRPLLWTLYVGVWWLPVALLLQLVRDGALVANGVSILGRAPVHAMVMGYFASLAVAMVTRVTAGHSGRPLAMDRGMLAVFAGIQLAAVARVVSELMAGGPWPQWLLFAAGLCWLAAIGAWVTQHVPIYWTPRRDGRPG